MKAYLDQNEIKAELVEMLSSFDAFCKEHSIRYSIAYGTLLGAIRHKGFIPWDDDIDVVLLREDYKKLIKLASADESIYLKCYENRDLLMPFAKVCSTKVQVDQSSVREGTAQHLWIDVFPLDSVPVAAGEVKRLYQQEKFWNKIYMSALFDPKQSGDGIKGHAKRIARSLIPVLRLNKLALRRASNLAQKKRSDTPYVDLLSFYVYGPRAAHLVKSSDFDELISISFEGREFPCLKCWDSYLSGIYGSYMTLPPVNQRITHQLTAWRELPE